MIIGSPFERAFLVLVFALLGIVLVGNLLVALHLEKLHPNVIGAAIGAMLGLALIEALPLLAAS
jgi:hypothetical protein